MLYELAYVIIRNYSSKGTLAILATPIYELLAPNSMTVWTLTDSSGH